MDTYQILLIANNIIKKTIAALLPYKPARSWIKNFLDDIFIPSAIENFKQIIEDEYHDYWIFVPFWPWGDFMMACALLEQFKKEKGGNILIFYANKSQLEFIKAFDFADEILPIPKEIYYSLCTTARPYCKHNKAGLKKGHIYELSHHVFKEAENDKSRNFFEVYIKMLQIAVPQLSKLNLTRKIKNKVEDIYDEVSEGKEVIMMTPHAHSFNEREISPYFWITTAKQLENDGYKVVFNSKSPEYEEFDSVFLPLLEQCYFATLCHSNITLRSGFTDIITIMGASNQVIIYPESMRFITITEEEQIEEISRCAKMISGHSFEENMFDFTSINNMFGKNFTEIIIDNKQYVSRVTNNFRTNYNELRKRYSGIYYKG